MKSFVTSDGLAEPGNGKTVAVRRRAQFVNRNMDGEVVRDVIYTHGLVLFGELEASRVSTGLGSRVPRRWPHSSSSCKISTPAALACSLCNLVISLADNVVKGPLQ